jgi:hypothetical protein
MTDSDTVSLPLHGRQVTQLRFDFAFGIELCEDEPRFSLRIGCPLTTTNGPVTASYDPEKSVQCGPLLALLHDRVHSAKATRTGRLEIVFTSGLTLRVDPHPQFEAWELVGSDGTRVISVPGGNLVTWSADRVKDQSDGLFGQGPFCAHDAGHLAFSIRSATHGTDVLVPLVAATGDPAMTRRIVQAMATAETGLAQDDASRMSLVLNDLEALALADRVTACCLMPHLLEIASGVLGAHDVTDALDLWLADVRDPRITLHVQYLAEHGEDEDVRNHFQRVIDNAR